MSSISGSETIMSEIIDMARGFSKPVTYTAYGHRGGGGSDPLLGYNGQLLDIVSQGYLLGNGHRLYSPFLMRFSSPDAVSPFYAGGINAYAYCAGDPVNRIDPSGRVSGLFKALNITPKTGLSSALNLQGLPTETFKPVIKRHFAKPGAGPLDLEIGADAIIATLEDGKFIIKRTKTRAQLQGSLDFYDVRLKLLHEKKARVDGEVVQLSQRLQNQHARLWHLEQRATIAELQLASLHQKDATLNVERPMTDPHLTDNIQGVTFSGFRGLDRMDSTQLAADQRNLIRR